MRRLHEVLPHAVVARGVRLRRGVPPALLRDGVQQHGLCQLFDVRKHVHELVQIVPVDGADVLEPAAVEEVVLVEPAFEAVFETAQHPAERARLLEGLGKAGVEGAVSLFGGHARDRAVGSAVLVDRHAVVVEHDDEVFGLFFGGEHRLERQPVAERRVADEADDLFRAARKVARVAQPDARRERVAAVPRDKGVEFALRGVGETAHAALCAQRVKASPREQLVRVRLVPDVEHELILREVEHLVQREDELHRAEVGGEVPAALFGGGNELPAQSARERLKLFYRIFFQLCQIRPSRARNNKIKIKIFYPFRAVLSRECRKCRPSRPRHTQRTAYSHTATRPFSQSPRFHAEHRAGLPPVLYRRKSAFRPRSALSLRTALPHRTPPRRIRAHGLRGGALSAIIPYISIRKAQKVWHIQSI